jgi:hypothetical protein
MSIAIFVVTMVGKERRSDREGILQNHNMGFQLFLYRRSIHKVSDATEPWVWGVFRLRSIVCAFLTLQGAPGYCLVAGLA